MYFPKETHGHRDVVTCYDALNDLAQVDPETGNGFVQLKSQDGQVSYVENHSIEGTSIKSETDKLECDKPAHTIIRKNNVGHYELKRTLTVREMGRLQSFPDSFVFCGTTTQQVNGIGNAVPVQTAKAVGISVLQMYKDNGKIQSSKSDGLT